MATGEELYRYEVQEKRKHSEEYEKSLQRTKEALTNLKMMTQRVKTSLLLAEGTEQYPAVKKNADALYAAVMALEKQIPKPVIRRSWMTPICPTCGGALGETLADGYVKEWDTMIVCNCGQQLDWSNPEEDEDEEE